MLSNECQYTNQIKPIYDTNLLEKIDSLTISNSTNMCHKGGESDLHAENNDANDVSSSLLKAEFFKTKDKDMVEKNF